MKKLRCPTIGRHAPLDRANGLLETRTSGVEPESPRKRTVVVITLLYQLSYWPPMNGNQVGLEPTTHGLSGNFVCYVLLYDHLKLQSQRLPPPKGTASHPRRGRGTGGLVASLGLTTKRIRGQLGKPLVGFGISASGVLDVRSRFGAPTKRRPCVSCLFACTSRSNGHPVDGAPEPAMARGRLSHRDLSQGRRIDFCVKGKSYSPSSRHSGKASWVSDIEEMPSSPLLGGSPVGQNGMIGAFRLYFPNVSLCAP